LPGVIGDDENVVQNDYQNCDANDAAALRDLKRFLVERFNANNELPIFAPLPGWRNWYPDCERRDSGGD